MKVVLKSFKNNPLINILKAFLNINPNIISSKKKTQILNINVTNVIRLGLLKACQFGQRCLWICTRFGGESVQRDDLGSSVKENQKKGFKVFIYLFIFYFLFIFMLVVKVKIASTNKVKQQVVEQLMVDIMHYIQKKKKKKKT